MKWRTGEVRLLWFYCVLLLILGGAFSVFTIVSFGRFETETILADVSARAQEVWTISSGSITDPIQLRDLIERRFNPAAQNRFIRLSSDGTILYQSARPANGAFVPDEVPLSAAEDNGSRPDHDHLYLVTKHFQLPNGRTILVQSGQSSEFARAIRANLISSLLVGLPVLLALAGLGGYVLIRQAWAPLGAMIRAAEAITFNNPHNRLPLAGTGDRIDVLGQALNRMLDRLDSAYQHASRFSADAAHELRTPLAIIRGELEYIAAQPGLSQETQTSLESISEEAKRLADMTENLLTIARMDSVWGKREHAPVNLLALARETIEQMNLLAEEKKIILEAPTGPPLFVAGDRNRLKQVLVNLLDNAIKYTGAGGGVRVRIEARGTQVELSVQDTGIGIAEEHLDDVFQRFFRVSTDRGQSGAGLGLAIARAICQAHGGALTVRSAAGTGSTFRVELPAAGSGRTGR